MTIRHFIIIIIIIIIIIVVVVIIIDIIYMRGWGWVQNGFLAIVLNNYIEIIT